MDAAPDPRADRALYRISSLAGRIDDPREALRTILSVAIETLGGSSGSISLLNPDTGKLEIDVHQGLFTETDEVWLDEEDGPPLGFHQLIPHGRDTLELDLFFTANAAQGRGVGRRLFEHMAGRARALGAKAVVISSNPKAADFYRRMGAIDIGLSPPVGEITWERPKLRLVLA